MTYQLFSAAGCVRCAVVKKYMTENHIRFDELDIKADGKEAFKSFYKENRKKVFRGENGIEFPVLFTGEDIYQGVGVALSFLIAENRLEKFVRQSDLCQGWVGGISLCNGSPVDGQALLRLMGVLKSHGLMVELETDGRHPELFEAIVRDGLADRIHFVLRGPAELYEQITGIPLAENELSQSLALLRPPLEYQITLPVPAVQGSETGHDCLTPETAARAAQFVYEATGSKTHPFFIHSNTGGEKPADPSVLFKYRTRCRPYMVKCDILKS